MDDQEPAVRVMVTWANSDCEIHAQEAIVLMVEGKMLKLALHRELSPLQQCTIALMDADGSPRDSVQATVHHVRPCVPYVHVTCELAEPLSETSIEKLVHSCNYNRRGGNRRPVTANVRARPELFPEALSIQVVDVSPGGCCLQSPVAVPVGLRVELFSWDDAGRVGAIVLRVKWQRPAEEGFLIGCEFAKPGGYSAFLALIADKSALLADAPRPRSLLGRAFYLAHAGMSLFRSTSA
jgi:hypothetical protein